MQTQGVKNFLLNAFIIFGLAFIFIGPSIKMAMNPYGKIADAEKVLKPGHVYECVTSLANVHDNVNDEGWYAIVKTEDKYFGLKFKYEPPLKGVVAKQEGTIVFIRIATANSGVTIPNPLSAEKPAEK